MGKKVQTVNKFITFKRSDFDKMMASLESDGVGPLVIDTIYSDELEDAIVIRKKDILAAPLLHTYSSMAQTAIEILNEVGAKAPETLSDIRDYFFQQAHDADSYVMKRLPD